MSDHLMQDGAECLNVQHEGGKLYLGDRQLWLPLSI